MPLPVLLFQLAGVLGASLSTIGKVAYITKIPEIFRFAQSMTNKPSTKDWIHIDVGGTKFLSTRTTLIKDPYSIFATTVFSSPTAPQSPTDVIFGFDSERRVEARKRTRWSLMFGTPPLTEAETNALKEAEAEKERESLKLRVAKYGVQGTDILLDRDPVRFKVVLNFLRYDKYLPDPNVTDRMILEEADFLEMKSLAKVVEKRLEQQKSRSEDCSPGEVYRYSSIA